MFDVKKARTGLKDFDLEDLYYIKILLEAEINTRDGEHKEVIDKLRIQGEKHGN